MKKIILISSCLLITAAAFGQYRGGLWSYTYDIAFPMGATGDYTSPTSFRGMTITGSSFVSENVSIGGQFTWNTFYEKLSDETQNFDFINDDDERVVGAVNGTQYRYINSFPLLLTGRYFNKNPVFESFALFGGLGVGTSIVKTRLELGIFSADEVKWHFTMAPEVGLVYGPGDAVKLFLSAQYFYSFKTSDTPEHTHLTLHVGFASTF